MKYTFHDSCSILPRNHKSVQKPKEQEAKTTNAKKKNKKLRSREDKSRKSHESNKSQTSKKKVNKSQKKTQKSQKQQKPKKSQQLQKPQKPRSQTGKQKKGPPICQQHQSTERTLYSSRKTSLQDRLDPSNTGLWLLLHNFSFGFLHFVLSQPDPFPCV